MGKTVLIILGVIVGFVILAATVPAMSGLAKQVQERPSKAARIWGTIGVVTIVVIVLLYFGFRMYARANGYDL